MRAKLAALVISALITGMAGGLWYYFIAAVHPQSAFDPLFDLVAGADGSSSAASAPSSARCSAR